MRVQVLQLTVNRQKILRFEQVQQKFQFFLAGVPAHVDIGAAPQNHIRAALKQPVYGPVDHNFIAGNNS